MSRRNAWPNVLARDEDQTLKARAQREAVILVRVAHIISSLDVGGAEMFLARLLRASPALAPEAHVIGLKGAGPVSELVRAAGARVTALGLEGPVSAAAGSARLRLLLAADRPDVVQTWLYHADLLGGLSAWGLAPVVWNLRLSNLRSASLSGSARAAVAASARLSRRLPSAIVCCSSSTRDEHVKLGYDTTKMRVIHNGFEAKAAGASTLRAKLEKELDIPSSAFVIAAIGRWHPMKNHLGFVDAVEPIVARHPQVHVVLAGLHLDWSNRSLVEHIESSASPKRFHLLGLRSDLPDLMPAFDLLVSASLSEGLPNAVGEAMASGVPCVCTDAGDTALLVGDTGRIVPRFEREAMTDAIEAYVNMPEHQRLEHGHRARDRIAKQFSLEAAAERYLDLYEELLGRHR